MPVQNTWTVGSAADHDPTRRRSGQAADRLSQRPATPGDRDFLLTLFAESRPELALLPQAVRPELIRMQFDSQLSQYHSSTPDAVDWILEVDQDGRSERVGRCYLWQGDQEHRLLDLAIRSQWRGQGLAGLLLARLCAGAAAAGVPLRLSVWAANQDALRLYHRHGFVADDAESDVAGYLRLRWSPGPADPIHRLEEEAR